VEVGQAAAATIQVAQERLVKASPADLTRHLLFTGTVAVVVPDQQDNLVLAHLARQWEQAEQV
jgi:hypothetical protein